MKKLILLFLVLVLKFAPSKAQWVTIPDANFVTKLQQLFPSCMNGNQMDTTCAGVVNATSLIVNSSNISNLFGVQYFDNLIHLDCNNNLLSGLPPMPNILEDLICNNNQLLSLPTFPNSLNILVCSYNQITYIPPVPSQMFMFFVHDNNITCFNNLPVTPIMEYGIHNNSFTCVPNHTFYSIDYPLCYIGDSINNPNNCLGVNISGKIFQDNNDCLLNDFDLLSQNIPVKLYDSQNNLQSTSYTSDGHYFFSNLTNDSYTVRIDDVLLPFSMDCGQPNTQVLNLTFANQGFSDVNFPITCDSDYDINVHSIINQGIVFPGQIHVMNTNVSNNNLWFNINCGSGSSSGIVKIVANGPISFVEPAPDALTPTVSGNTYTYTISDFNTLNPNSFGLRLLTDTTAQATDQICVHVEISPNPIDADTTNNVYDFCYNVVNSYDPNMKEVYPVNVLPGYDDWFTYTIHFQNTGNAPAFNIRLRDTLDTQLDLNTFEVLGYSHPANVTVSGNILTVRFNNIMLPDSTSDYEGSMGYFQYRLKPLPNMPNGSQISNTCYIYFDYNAPIITNTTENNFDITVPVKSLDSTENSFSLYPNPSSGVFTFKDTKNLISVEVYSILGEKILNQTNQKTINLNGFSKGVYFARVNGGVVLKMVKE
jgi:uncharacterized repeat protein (TIGR01451 family)